MLYPRLRILAADLTAYAKAIHQDALSYENDPIDGVSPWDLYDAVHGQLWEIEQYIQRIREHMGPHPIHFVPVRPIDAFAALYPAGAELPPNF